MKPHNFIRGRERFEMLADKAGPIHPVHGRCWQWKGFMWKGRRQIRATMGLCNKRVYASRYAWELYHGPIPKGEKVLHKCDNPLCVNPDHLFLGSQADNISDMVSKSRQAKGEGCRHKLTTEQVKAIRKLYVPRHPTRGSIPLSKLFGVSRFQIERIANGTSRRYE